MWLYLIPIFVAIVWTGGMDYVDANGKMATEMAKRDCYAEAKADTRYPTFGELQKMHVKERLERVQLLVEECMARDGFRPAS